MPTVRHLQIYPVKSLDGQAVERVAVLPSGALAGDRTYALVDEAGNLLSAKKHPAMHQLRSTLHIAEGVLDVADMSVHGLGRQTFDLESERTDLTSWLATFFGFPVSLRDDRLVGFPDDLDSPGPTIISTATLRETGSWFGLSVDEMRARLRANIEVDGEPPFWEDRLFGSGESMPLFSIGEVRFRGINPCQRCIVPTRHPTTGEADASFAHVFAERRRTKLPPWSPPDRFDHYYRAAVNTRLDVWRPGLAISVGDTLVLDLPYETSDAQENRSNGI